MEIEITKLEDGDYHWVDCDITISKMENNNFTKAILKFRSLNTGCGICSMKGNITLSNLTDNELFELREFLLNINIHTYEKNLYKPLQKGLIIATLGIEHNNDEEYNKRHKEILFKLGFEKLTSYINPNDTKNYEKPHIQACYGLYPYVSKEYQKESKQD